MGKRLLYVAAESDPLHLHALRNRFLRTPNVVVQRLDPQVAEDVAGLENRFDTVLCLNVLEYAADPEAIVRAVSTALETRRKPDSAAAAGTWAVRHAG